MSDLTAPAALYVAGWLAGQDTAELWPAPPAEAEGAARAAWFEGFFAGCVARLVERWRA